MNIDGLTRTCGLIGNPVEHTLSPAIHNALARKLGQNMVYVPFPVKDGQLSEAIQGAYALNMLGLNITVPYKSEVIKELTDLDELAQQIGAVNTLVRTEQGFKGFNTDMPGLYRALCSEGIQIEGEEMIILGAGGAARAVAYLCMSKNVSKIYMLNRSPEKAREVAKEVNTKCQRECIIPMSLSDYDKLPDRKFLAIQATSVGLYPETIKAVIEDDAFYRKIHTGYDLIYRPPYTCFMRHVVENGGKAYHGLKMLLYQGIISYELWNQVTVSEELAGEIYDMLKTKMGMNEEHVR